MNKNSNSQPQTPKTSLIMNKDLVQINTTPKRQLQPVSKNTFLNKILYKSFKTCSEKVRKRINDIILCLLIKDYDSLKKYTFEGLPDEMPLLRSLIWKINLKYVPFNLDKWDESLKKKRNEYEDLKTVLLSKLHYEYTDNHSKIDGISDIKLLEDIDKDVKRTYNHMNFFSMPSKKDLNITNNEICKYYDEYRIDGVSIESILYDRIKEDSRKFNWESNASVLLRILYIYAKINTDIGYVQGMNELLAPIYYSYFSEEDYFSSSSSLIHNESKAFEERNEENQYIVNVEADSFWTFSNLMEEMRNLYIKDKDNQPGGVFDKLQLVSEMLKIVEKEIFSHFEKIKLDLKLFAFRWIVLLFTQDFELIEVLRLWDAILCEENRFYIVNLICISILRIKKKEILKNNFSGCILLLSKVKISCDTLLNECINIRSKFEKRLLKVMNIST